MEPPAAGRHAENVKNRGAHSTCLRNMQVILAITQAARPTNQRRRQERRQTSGNTIMPATERAMDVRNRGEHKADGPVEEEDKEAEEGSSADEEDDDEEEDPELTEGEDDDVFSGETGAAVPVVV